MFVIEEGNVTSVSKVPKNALSPIVLREEGKTMDCKLLPRKATLPITLIDSGKLICVSSVHP